MALEGNSTGSSLILSYNLQWDKGTNELLWYDLQGDGVNTPDSTETSSEVTTDVVPGT